MNLKFPEKFCEIISLIYRHVDYFLAKNVEKISIVLFFVLFLQRFLNRSF
jgi:hypothetical protein